MGFDSNDVYHLFRQEHKQLHEDLWHLIERREPRFCWRWLGDHDSEGYAEYTFEHNGTLYTLNVHRYLHYAIYDELPSRVPHTCHNTWCCNINHLAVTREPAPAVLC
ncbi:MAG: hypothetical protein JSW27_19085 [Phycisphaerales bacterium]|nr:MAG: hypothetical protein JSW27_19085 [Phycisphaerales bacterium]